MRVLHGRSQAGNRAAHIDALVLRCHSDRGLVDGDGRGGLGVHRGVRLILCGDRCRARLQNRHRSVGAGASHAQYGRITGTPSPGASSGAHVGSGSGQGEVRIAVGLAGGNAVDGHARVGLV